MCKTTRKFRKFERVAESLLTRAYDSSDGFCYFEVHRVNEHFLFRTRLEDCSITFSKDYLWHGYIRFNNVSIAYVETAKNVNGEEDGYSFFSDDDITKMHPISKDAFFTQWNENNIELNKRYNEYVPSDVFFFKKNPYELYVVIDKYKVTTNMTGGLVATKYYLLVNFIENFPKNNTVHTQSIYLAHLNPEIISRGCGIEFEQDPNLPIYNAYQNFINDRGIHN